jgi:Mlc titration factor MtfA (ptsG expression regulator)
VIFYLNRKWKRQRLATRPFPAEWRSIVDSRLPFAATLPADEFENFLTHLKVFCWEKYFFGVKGLELTEEMKVIISGSAARISRNMSLDVYDRLTEVVVYPATYKHPDRHGGVLGEAHSFGTVVLSWDAVDGGIATPNDGHDTAIHEFAHVLDIADGLFDGTPEIDSDAFDCWVHAMGTHFERLQNSPQKGPFRAYGATNEAEFFAVATETFFEQPVTLQRKAPEVYTELKRFFRVDPARQDRPRPTTRKRSQ